jgi:hypothetical protein
MTAFGSSRYFKFSISFEMVLSYTRSLRSIVGLLFVLDMVHSAVGVHTSSLLVLFVGKAGTSALDVRRAVYAGWEM